MDQALGPREDTPQRPHPSCRLTGGGHPGDGAVSCSRPAPAPASSPGYCCLWALACPALWDALLGWPHLAYCPLREPFRAAGHAGLFLTGCRMSRRCLAQGRSDGFWLARCCPPHGDRELAHGGAWRPRDSLSTPCQAEHLGVPVPRSCCWTPPSPATASEGPGRGGVLGVCSAWLSAHTGPCDMRVAQLAWEQSLAKPASSLQAAGEATWTPTTGGGRCGVARLHPKSHLVPQGTAGTTSRLLPSRD